MDDELQLATLPAVRTGYSGPGAGIFRSLSEFARMERELSRLPDALSYLPVNSRFEQFEEAELLLRMESERYMLLCSIGTALNFGDFDVVLNANTRYPVSATRTYTNANDNLSLLTLQILEGENSLCFKNKLIGVLGVNVPRRKAGENQIVATFSVDKWFVLRVHLRVEETGEEASTTIKLIRIRHRRGIDAEEEVHAKTASAIQASEIERYMPHAERMAGNVLISRWKSLFNVEPAFKSDFQTKFNVIKILGRGTYGVVFEVEDRKDKRRKYAIKRISLQGRQRYLTDALREISIQASFDCLGIVKYEHSWGERPPVGWQMEADEKLLQKLKLKGFLNYKADSAFLYLQMELCESSLANWLSENKDRNLLKIKCWFKQIVTALSYIHQQGYIHRDLKPHNILFASADRLKICDLGLITDREMMRGHEVASTRTVGRGTVMYMAPEQNCGYPRYTSKVDIFALGLILAEMCVVLTPDEADQAFEMYQRGKMPTILNHLPHVEKLVAWLTSYKDSDRPRCQEVLNHSFLGLCTDCRVPHRC